MHARLFTPGYIDGVTEFMSFIHEKFGEDEAILCPCSRCLNQKYQHQSVVERHILMYGMESTYTRWIHHGENFDVDVLEHPVVVHDHAGGLIQGLGVTENDNNGSLQWLSLRMMTVVLLISTGCYRTYAPQRKNLNMMVKIIMETVMQALSNLMRTTTWLMKVVPFLVLMSTTRWTMKVMISYNNFISFHWIVDAFLLAALF
jgi:hypothetical protein